MAQSVRATDRFECLVVPCATSTPSVCFRTPTPKIRHSSTSTKQHRCVCTSSDTCRRARVLLTQKTSGLCLVVSSLACGSPFNRAVERDFQPLTSALTGMKKVLWPTIWLSAAALLAAGLASISKMGFWWSFLIVAGAILINGWVATFEDDLPGGFNNPDGTSTPRYAIVASWGLRAIGGVLALLCVGVLALHFFGTP